MVFSDCAKKRMLLFHKEGHGPCAIVALLGTEQISTNVNGFAKTYQQTGTTVRQKGKEGKRKVTKAVKDIVERQMRIDDEATATQLCTAVARGGHILSTQTDLRWTYQGSAYCQVIRDVNKANWLKWARTNVGVISQMLFSPMSVAFRWRATATFAATNTRSCIRINRG